MRDYFERLSFNKLTEVQEKIKKVPMDKNILILSNCGSGKTEAAHYKLLDWNNKCLFVQPQKTLATSIYNRLNKYHKNLSLQKWTIQHSSYSEDRFLDNKFCVTTIDQVLGGWLGLGRQAFIKGKNVITSNIVFDEVQLFEPDKTLLTTMNMLNSLMQHGNRFIIMTATMPEYLIDFLSKQFDMDVIICEKDSVENREVCITLEENLDCSKINSYIKKQIIICNTQSQQIQVYNSIVDKNRCIVLNSKLLNDDRQSIETEVIKYFGNGSTENNKILITTQIIEAGMDISADCVYSASCPIDNLVQRAGRCSRWGGAGNFTVFKTEDIVYIKDIVKATIDVVERNNRILFTWDIQKKWINDILNPFYRRYINNKAIKLNKIALKNNQRNRLIRNIENINIIVDDNVSQDSFNKQSVSIHIDILKKLSEENIIYILDKKDIKEVACSQVEIGDTVVIQGNDCIYDNLGFRYSKGYRCEPFKKYNEGKANIDLIDYKEESWIHHADAVRELVMKHFRQENFSKYVIDNVEHISNILGLHDLGKLDVIWQGSQWANAKDVPLAHFPLRRGNPSLFKGRNHAVIGAYILKEHVDDVLFNVVLQHHKRYINDGSFIELREFELDKRYKQCLQEYGFDEDMTEKTVEKRISYNDVINPTNDNWNEFLYLVGTLMQCDIESITKQIDI